ncbi:hypothetical protein A9Z42_0051420 [Trichoderma parareesei]|uniref:Uncharacterized protein n=1 Tax=Trichoderma parareesei TaxID=858221 RepID=A0A2H2ZV47_TRIPA|nr:hypothetical protein A9Z42_0051420 [Trichoderma parareesei]
MSRQNGGDGGGGEGERRIVDCFRSGGRSSTTRLGSNESSPWTGGARIIRGPAAGGKKGQKDTRASKRVSGGVNWAFRRDAGTEAEAAAAGDGRADGPDEGKS